MYNGILVEPSAQSSRIDHLADEAQGIVVPFCEELYGAHQAFAQKMWPSKRRRREPEYNRWKFRGKASGPVDGLLLAVVNGEVVGQLGVIPVRLRIDGQDYPAQWACDLMVDPLLRRRKLGSLLFAAAMKRTMITLGSDPSEKADLTMTHLGFRPLKGPVKMILPVNAAHILRWKLPQLSDSLADALGRCIEPLIRLRSFRLAQTQGSDGVRLAKWHEAVPLLRKRFIRIPHVVHDDAFYEWRCSGLAGYSSQLDAFISGSGSAAIVEGSPSYYYVYEWLANGLSESRSLFAAILQHARIRKSQTIMVFANTNDEVEQLKHLGFLAMRTPVKVIYYPSGSMAKHASFHYTIFDSDGNL